MKLDKTVQLESATYKTDYFLIHKYNESEFFKRVGVPNNKILSDKIEFPPLVKEYISQQMKIKGIHIIEQPKMKIIFNKTGLKRYQITKEKKIATEQKLSMRLDLSVTPRLYNNIIND
jgi:hypothetical protein